MELTADGERVLAKFREVVGPLGRMMFDGLPEDDLAAAARVLAHLREFRL